MDLSALENANGGGIFDWFGGGGETPGAGKAPDLGEGPLLPPEAPPGGTEAPPYIPLGNDFAEGDVIPSGREPGFMGGGGAPGDAINPQEWYGAQGFNGEGGANGDTFMPEGGFFDPMSDGPSWDI